MRQNVSPPGCEKVRDKKSILFCAEVFTSKGLIPALFFAVWAGANRRMYGEKNTDHTDAGVPPAATSRSRGLASASCCRSRFVVAKIYILFCIIRYMDSLPEDKFYPYAEETEKILGCVFDVYHYFGPGFLESVYHKCLGIELTKAGIPFESEKKLQIFYKGEDIGLKFSADIVVDNKIILELKAKDRLKTEDEAQILHYLKISGYPLGLLINFGSKRKAEVRRFINTYPPFQSE